MAFGIEIDSAVADDPERSVIGEQVEMGVAVRMAVLDALSRAVGAAPAHPKPFGESHRCPPLIRGAILLVGTQRSPGPSPLRWSPVDRPMNNGQPRVRASSTDGRRRMCL